MVISDAYAETTRAYFVNNSATETIFSWETAVFAHPF